MRVHSAEKIEKLKELRKKGSSINEIVKRLSIPKTTVWHHIRGIKISPKYIAELKAKQGGSIVRKKRKMAEASELSHQLLKGRDRDLCIATAMLYWGEGSKKVCEFINSDGRMIKVYLAMIRGVLNIPDESIKPIMRIYTGMDKDKCLDYWSSITKISKDKFTIRFNDGGTKGRTKYGMCRIIVRKGSDTLKLMHSLIDQFYNEIIKKKK